MASRRNLTDAETLELYRVSLENANKQPQIKAILTELGYDTAIMEEGNALLSETRKAYDYNRIEDDETSAAYAHFSKLKAELEGIFDIHRKKAKVIFRKDPVTADQLAISGPMPRTYMKWLESAKKFYGVAATDQDVLNKLGRLKLGAADIATGNALINELETARTEYLREKGESQDATKLKDAAFSKIRDWMSDFYEVAKIGLDDNPQLLESLGKMVRS
ncbi:hypothetical protein [uncultured Cyclobacterium sp.]|uniref:hypothetical protein n=1 Tax=uncultured Cyclobacterium sp. TaxID=453820 RepID=UPI0030EF3983